MRVTTILYNLFKMFLNKDYENDIEYGIGLIRVFSRLLGIWPHVEKKPSFFEVIKKALLIFARYFLLFFDLVPTILYIVIIETRRRVILKIIGTAIYKMQTLVKYSYLLLNSSQIKNCLRHINDDWHNVASASNRDLMLNRARNGKRIAIFFAICMYGSGFYFRIIVPYSRGKIVTDQNITIRHLACPNYFIIFDVQKSPAYEIVFIIQILSGFIKYTCTAMICSLAALLAMHICAQLEILTVLINNLMNERKIEKINETLVMTVEHQNRIRK